MKRSAACKFDVGKRAKPDVPDSEKLEPMQLRLRADNRQVPAAEIDTVVAALQGSANCYAS